MEKINTLNYESYYLDFLEGNLSENDARDLLNFLDKHPEFKVDENLPTLDDTNQNLNSFVKSSLKKFDETLAISQDTLEDFIIAKNEGVLTEEKLSKLHSSALYDKKMDEDYQSIKLVPDTRQKYNFKASLKKKNKKVTPLFWWAAAAGIAIVIGLNVNWNSDIEINNPVVFSEKNNDVDSLNKSRIKNNIEEQIQIQKEIKSQQKEVIEYNQNILKEKDVYLKNNSPEKLLDIDTTKRIDQPVQKPIIIDKPFDIGPIAENNYSIDETKKVNQEDLASLAPVKMTNPIKPITDFFEEKTSIDLDYQHSEKNANDKRSFKLKIGKFSISRNRK